MKTCFIVEFYPEIIVHVGYNSHTLLSSVLSCLLRSLVTTIVPANRSSVQSSVMQVGAFTPSKLRWKQVPKSLYMTLQ